jgi:hypothetical protein
MCTGSAWTRRNPDVDVSFARRGSGDRIRELWEVGPDRDENDTDDEGRSPECGGERPCVGNSAVAGNKSDSETANEERDLKSDLHGLGDWT